MSTETPVREGQVLTGMLFNEPMRVLTVHTSGANAWVVGLVGQQSEQFRQVTLGPDEVSCLTIVDTAFSYDGDGRLLRIGLQAYALGIAYEFDPYFGLSISRVDPLPHQLEAVYEYLLKLPNVRFLLADDAGGGSIPLEALRLGCEAFASDLNPVACLILKVMLEDIPRHGPGLADELRRVGADIKAKAEVELADLYPKNADGATPIAYLWARTVRCEAPGCGAEIPLRRSFWLCTKPKRRRALRVTWERGLPAHNNDSAGKTPALPGRGGSRELLSRNG